MSSIKSKETKLEKSVRKNLSGEGVKYRKNSLKHFGKPDIVIASKKIVLFIDSCFWHGCKKHCRMPATNKKYWVNKIARNKGRDKEVNKYYKESKWKIIRIWEHDDDKKIKAVLQKINKK